VLHFILLVGRCFSINRSWNKDYDVWLKRRIEHEEGTLMDLMERRRALIEETEELEARRGVVEQALLPPRSREDHHQDEELQETCRGAVERPLPSVPPAEDELHNNHGRDEEDLIDMATAERGASGHLLG
jgi:hypothetical protein